MNRQEFSTLCNLNKIDTSKIVIGYDTYNIVTDKTTIEYQSFIYYDLTTNQYNQYDIEYNDIRKHIKNCNVIDVEWTNQVIIVDIKTKRLFNLPDKFKILDTDLFFKCNANV